MHKVQSAVVVLSALLAMAGCASLPSDQGYKQTSDLIQARLGTSPGWSTGTVAQMPTEPLSARSAVLLAFEHNPQIRQAYAQLGLGRADLEQARRISNPSFSYSTLDVVDGHGTQITRSLAVMFSDLLLLPSRKRLALGELDRVQMQVAARLLNLASEVEVAWYNDVGAQQVAAMRELAAKAAEASATMAQRFHDAGNIGQLQLAQERAAATMARIDAVRAAADAQKARAELAGLLGLSAAAEWRTLNRLPAPLENLPEVNDLVSLALEQRLDLSAAHQNVVLREDVLGVTRRWRLLGSVDLEYEREKETDGGRLQGPSIGLELPIFDQGQAELQRAHSELIDARAELDGLLLDVANHARLGVEQLALYRDIAERYQQTLVPAREAIVARTQEEVNFMLVGVFELLLAKREEYDAYQEFLEAVRDYWIARTELRRIVGGRLPEDDLAPPPATLGLEGLGSPDSSSANGDSSSAGTTDPHAGHRMSEPAEQPSDPHAGHGAAARVNPENAASADAPKDDAPIDDKRELGDSP